MIELLGYSAIALLAIKYFEPIQPAREKMVEVGIKYMIKWRLWFLKYLFIVLSCPYCFSFWFTVGITQNLYKAAIVAIITKIIDLTIQKLSNND